MQLSEEISEEQVFHYMSTKTKKRELPNQKGEPRQKMKCPQKTETTISNSCPGGLQTG